MKTFHIIARTVTGELRRFDIEAETPDQAQQKYPRLKGEVVLHVIDAADIQQMIRLFC